MDASHSDAAAPPTADSTDAVDEPFVSDDEEIDYSVKPQFYDPDLDDKDQLWVQKKRNGRASDAILSCPACFTTLCLECQRICILIVISWNVDILFVQALTFLPAAAVFFGTEHAKYPTQYRAMFVVNCKIQSSQILRASTRKRQREAIPRAIPSEDAENVTGCHDKASTVRPVCCSVCGIGVGVIDEDEVYHFFNVLPSEG